MGQQMKVCLDLEICVLLKTSTPTLSRIEWCHNDPMEHERWSPSSVVSR